MNDQQKVCSRIHEACTACLCLRCPTAAAAAVAFTAGHLSRSPAAACWVALSRSSADDQSLQTRLSAGKCGCSALASLPWLVGKDPNCQHGPRAPHKALTTQKTSLPEGAALNVRSDHGPKLPMQQPLGPLGHPPDEKAVYSSQTNISSR